MNSLLGRAFAALRTWLGFNDPSDNRLHPVHGWLLPDAALVRARLAPVTAIRSAIKVRFEGGR